MCIVSNIMDYGRGMWPTPSVPQPIVIPSVATPVGPTPEQWAEFLELVRKAKAFDEMTGEAECEDPEKVAWFDEMNESVNSVEKLFEDTVTLVSVEINDYVVRKTMLEIWISCPVLDDQARYHYVRRQGNTPQGRDWGWFCNDTGGGLPNGAEQRENVLNGLVLNHSLLCQLADQYEIY